MTAVIIIIAAVLVLIGALYIFISVKTAPVSDSLNPPSVGGMLKSDSVNYKSSESKGIEKYPIIKIMQLNWKMIAKSDEKNHASQRPPKVNQHNDIPYIDDGNKFHMLDVYTPLDDDKNCPVIIDIHGGGWMYGDKELNKYYCMSLAARGYTVFNISYRLAPDVTVDQQLQDIAVALKWIKENMSNYTDDDKNILLTGDSAGGQLAVYSAVLAGSEELRDIFGTVQSNLTPSALLLTSPAPFMKTAGIGIYTKLLWGKDYKRKKTYGYMDFDEIIKFAQLPPTYLITSSGDSVARKQTIRVAEALKENNTEYVLRDYPPYNNKPLPHVFSVLNPFDEIGSACIDDALDFFKSHYRTEAAEIVQ